MRCRDLFWITKIIVSCQAFSDSQNNKCFFEEQLSHCRPSGQANHHQSIKYSSYTNNWLEYNWLHYYLIQIIGHDYPYWQVDFAFVAIKPITFAKITKVEVDYGNLLFTWSLGLGLESSKGSSQSWNLKQCIRIVSKMN